MKNLPVIMNVFALIFLGLGTVLSLTVEHGWILDAILCGFLLAYSAFVWVHTSKIENTSIKELESRMLRMNAELSSEIHETKNRINIVEEKNSGGF